MAFYPEEFIDEVKSSNDIVDVISGYVNLKRHGTTYFGNCPFHREKTASFAVTPEKQIFHCFGCGVGGNVISFVQKIENLGFKEAVEMLAERAKLALPADDKLASQESKDDLKIKEYHKSQMYNINKDAGKFFFLNINKSKIAQEYIKQRKLNIETVKKFGIGFALDDNSLLRFLKEKGYKEEDMLATGLVGKSEKGILYDKFKNRLMFPIFDVRGRVVAFGGRAIGSHEELKEKHIPKYVNSPENLIYIKGKHLYGLNIAKQSTDKLKKILVVEGYMDVVTPHSYGVSNVVASLGTALTENQGKLLRQYAEEVVLSYDSDQAGQNAIMRGIDVLQELGVTCKVLQMKDAKDPDEYVLKYGGEKFTSLINSSITAVEYKIQMLKRQYDLNDTTDKIRFLNKMADILAKVPNNIERDIYIEKLSKDLGVGKEALIAEVEKHLFKSEGTKEKTFTLTNNDNNTSIISSSDEKIEETILYLLTSKSKEVFNKISKIVMVDDFKGEVTKGLLPKFYDAYINGSIKNIDLTSLCTNEAELNIMTKIMLKPNTSADFAKITDEVLTNYNMQKMQNRKNELLNLMKNTDDKEKLNLYQSELREIISSTIRK